MLWRMLLIWSAYGQTWVPSLVEEERGQSEKCKEYFIQRLCCNMISVTTCWAQLRMTNGGHNRFRSSSKWNGSKMRHTIEDTPNHGLTKERQLWDSCNNKACLPNAPLHIDVTSYGMVEDNSSRWWSSTRRTTSYWLENPSDHIRTARTILMNRVHVCLRQESTHPHPSPHLANRQTMMETNSVPVRQKQEQSATSRSGLLQSFEQIWDLEVLHSCTPPTVKDPDNGVKMYTKRGQD